MKILDVVEEEYDFWDKIGRVVLAMKDTTLSSCIEYMRLPFARCNELMLYILCRIYYRHAVVHTLKRPWTTVHCNTGFTFETLPSLCHPHLVYLGEHIYGERWPLPMCAALVVTPYALQFPSRKQRKGQHKVVDLSVKQAEHSSVVSLAAPTNHQAIDNNLHIKSELSTMSTSKLPSESLHTQVFTLWNTGNDRDCSKQSGVTEDTGQLVIGPLT